MTTSTNSFTFFQHVQHDAILPGGLSEVSLILITLRVSGKALHHTAIAAIAGVPLRAGRVLGDLEVLRKTVIIRVAQDPDFKDLVLPHKTSSWNSVLAVCPRK